MKTMRKALQNKARKVAFGVGMGALLAFPVATMVSTTAGAAAPTCYPGCSSPSTGLPITTGDGSAAATTVVATSAATPNSLAFTGADLGGLVAVSAGALGAGTVLVRLSRRHRRTA
jgi:hypothetical protein